MWARTASRTVMIDAAGNASANSAGAASVISCVKTLLQRTSFTGASRSARGKSRAWAARLPPSPRANSSYRSSTSSRGSILVFSSVSVDVRFLPWRDRDVEPLFNDDCAPLKHLDGADPVEGHPYPGSDALVELLAEGGGVRGLLLALFGAHIVEGERALELVETLLVLEK